MMEALDRFAKAGMTEGEVGESSSPSESTETALPLIQVGSGLASLPKKLVEKIEAEEYIDFSELPPAKGKGRSMTQAFEGQIIVVQAADLMQTRKLIPDLATWVQCFGLFMAVVARKRPDRVPDLIAYMATIAKASQKYQWPAWIFIIRSEFQAGGGGEKRPRMGQSRP